MNTESLVSIENRLDRVEREVRALQSGQTALAVAIGNLRGEVGHVPAAPRQVSKESPPELGREAVCPKCNGGNPPLALRCMWCGVRMPLSDAVILRPVGAAASPPRMAPPPVARRASGLPAP